MSESAVCDDRPAPLLWTPDKVELRSPFALPMQGAWPPNAIDACPVGPYGHLCEDHREYKTVSAIGRMSPSDPPPDPFWHPRLYDV